MAVTITGGRIPPRERAFNPNLHSEETATQSLASTPQAVLLTTNLTTFGGGTASGPLADLYTLEDGTEGAEKELLMLATGEAKIDLTGTASRITLEESDAFVYLRFKKGKWRRFAPIAATATAAGGGGDPHFVSHDITHTAGAGVAASFAGANTLAIGDNPSADAFHDIAMGDSATTGRSAANVEFSGWNHNIAIGSSARADGSVGRSVAIGWLAKAQWNSSIAIGHKALTATDATSAIAIGDRATATGNTAIAIGFGADSAKTDSVAIGNNAVAGVGNSGVAIGTSANAVATDAIAIGNTANAQHNNAIAIGQNSTAQGINSIALGKDASESRDECSRFEQTGALRLPVGTTAQQPSNVEGDLRYNTTLNALEYNTGTGWKQIATA